MKQPAVDAQTSTRKSPVHGMKWIKLGEGKDPEFNKTVFLYDKSVSEPQDAVCTGWLKAIESEIGKKIYKFVVGYDKDNGGDIINSSLTHYSEIKPPVD